MICMIHINHVMWLVNPFTATWRSERHLPPSRWRRLDVEYVKSVKIGARGFYIIMRAGMKGLNSFSYRNSLHKSSFLHMS